MNWKLLVLLLVLAGHGYRLLLEMVHYRSANNPTPANVADVYDAETYQRWKRYSAEKSRLSILTTVVSLILTVALLCLNAHAAVAGLFGSNVYVQLIAVLVFQALVETVANVGLNWVDTMVIEQKYGFNRSTVRTFVTDQLRGFVLELVLTIALMSLLALIYQALGDWVILLFAGAVFAITLVIAFLYGPVFSRMGNKFVPLEDGELKEKLMALLTKHGYQVKAIEVMDASRRTTKLNAYFTGFGRLKRIVLFDNLLRAMTTDEICAVFSHELGHGLHKDVLKQQLLNFVNLLVMAVTVWLCVRIPGLHTAFGFAEVNYGFAYVLLGAGLGLLQPLTGMMMNAYSRRAEYRADQQAVKEGYGEYLTAALKTLAKENFSHLSPSPLLVVLEYSHPPLSQRVEAIDRALNKR
ncbi:MAG: M48 family metallopeptidase [Aristaeellaceae bacterium]